jgi:hypothetical protein
MVTFASSPVVLPPTFTTMDTVYAVNGQVTCLVCLSRTGVS